MDSIIKRYHQALGALCVRLQRTGRKTGRAFAPVVGRDRAMIASFVSFADERNNHGEV
ncbi:hypothetical protein [Bradyrhizobium pachyrhizi]|uniref:hypothetical protein n=1 Tax=Bradyrhizobium pachyrhizi TaxID=280333 RepID=UPI000AD2F1A4|nr:hypothetical protein [Bradyrhizobium pachyrhizi]